LFVPAIRKDFLEKLDKYNCDVVILDLEDSVMPSHKEEARKNLYDLDFNRIKNKEILIRINSVDGPFITDDLKLVNNKNPDGIMIPKLDDEKQIEFLEKNTMGMEFVPIIETIKGFFNAHKILVCSKRITSFAFGAEDFCMESEIKKGNLKENPVLLNVISTLLLIAKQNNLWYIDCVYTGFGTEEHLNNLKEEAEFTKNFGANAKLLIHPSQIDVVNDIFSISKDEIQKAKEFLNDFENLKTGSFVVTHDNIMEDTPSYKKYTKLLGKAKRLGYI